MKNDPLKMKRRSAQQAYHVGQSYFRFLFQLAQVQVQVHLFTLIQLQYNNNKKKKEVKTELTIHWIKHNKGKKCVAAKGAKLSSWLLPQSGYKWVEVIQYTRLTLHPPSRSCHLEFSLALKSKESGLSKSKNCLAKTNVILVLGTLSNNDRYVYENVTLKIVQARPVKRSEDSNYFKLD